MDINTLTEYLKIHKISLVQDLDQHHSKDVGYHYSLGQIHLVDHLLEYIDER